jgi:hypothetical protein
VGYRAIPEPAGELLLAIGAVVLCGWPKGRNAMR